MIRSLTRSELEAEGERLGRSLASGAVVTFEGELGAGKTTFIKAITRGSASAGRRAARPMRWCTGTKDDAGRCSISTVTVCGRRTRPPTSTGKGCSARVMPFWWSGPSGPAPGSRHRARASGCTIWRSPSGGAWSRSDRPGAGDGHRPGVGGGGRGCRRRGRERASSAPGGMRARCCRWSSAVLARQASGWRRRGAGAERRTGQLHRPPGRRGGGQGAGAGTGLPLWVAPSLMVRAAGVASRRRAGAGGDRRPSGRRLRRRPSASTPAASRRARARGAPAGGPAGGCFGPALWWVNLPEPLAIGSSAGPDAGWCGRRRVRRAPGRCWTGRPHRRGAAADRGHIMGARVRPARGGPGTMGDGAWTPPTGSGRRSR